MLRWPIQFTRENRHSRPTFHSSSGQLNDSPISQQAVHSGGDGAAYYCIQASTPKALEHRTKVISPERGRSCRLLSCGGLSELLLCTELLLLKLNIGTTKRLPRQLGYLIPGIYTFAVKTCSQGLQAL